MSPKSAYAFFDVDETLIRPKSMFSFLSYLSRETGWIKADEIIGRLRQMSADGASRKDVNREYYQAYAGLNRDEVRYLARRWLESMLAVGAQHFFNGAVLSRLRMHAANGVEPVFVSGSAFDLLEPLAAHLRVQRCLATELEVTANGVYSGQLQGPVMIGDGKAAAVRQLMSQDGADPSTCFAYGDHSSDRGMLEAVGNPVVIPGDPTLVATARSRGWTVLSDAAPTASGNRVCTNSPGKG